MTDEDKRFRDMLDKRLIKNAGGNYETVILAQRNGEPVREIKSRHTDLQIAITSAMHTATINMAKAVFVYSLAQDGKTWRSVDKDGYVYSMERPFDHLTGGWIDKAKLIESCNSTLPKKVLPDYNQVAEKIGMTRPY